MPPRTATVTRLLETAPAVPAAATSNASADMDRDGVAAVVTDGRAADDDVSALLADIDRNEGVDAILAVRLPINLPRRDQLPITMRTTFQCTELRRASDIRVDQSQDDWAQACAPLARQRQWQ